MQPGIDGADVSLFIHSTYVLIEANGFLCGCRSPRWREENLQ